MNQIQNNVDDGNEIEIDRNQNVDAENRNDAAAANEGDETDSN